MKKNHICTPFGKKVKIRLLEENMTSKDLARVVGVADSTICDVVFGRNKRIKTLMAIAKALGIDDEEF